MTADVQERICNHYRCEETDELVTVEVSGGGLLGFLCELHAEELEYMWRREAQKKIDARAEATR